MNEAQTILFGADSTTGIVAVEVVGSEAVIFIRSSDSVRETRVPFSPWLLISREQDVPISGRVTILEGEGFRFLVTFGKWSDFVVTRDNLRQAGIDCFAYPTPEKQFLTVTGMTLFKGLTFNEIHRMQIDIETTGLSAEGSQILLVAVSDNRGLEEILDGKEPEIIKRLVALIVERDPDVIEGHNIFGFDLPFLAKRARVCGVPLSVGRDGSDVSFCPERTCPIGGHSRPFIPARIFGRHIIDTLLAVQRFDVGRGRLERHGLKDCARALGVAEPGRLDIPGNEIASVWETDSDRVRGYALHDVRETGRLAALACPPEFYLAQMVPDTYQSVATTGTGEKINSIMVREYLRRGHAIPNPQPASPIPGGYTELRTSGLVRRVVKCDVESLYPTLMLSKRIKPSSDVLDVFLPALAELTRRRIEAKSRARLAPEPERAYWDSLQGSFKILINSFYGYLGAPFNFNDFEAAARVTTSGQVIVKRIAELIERRGGRVIEIDTDGVYFQAPEWCVTEDAEKSFVGEVGSELPEGINLVYDGRYAAMLSLKVKNYVLVGYDGTKVFRGASVRSRADEPFGRKFISDAVDLLVKGDCEGVARLYRELAERIRNGLMPVQEFGRRERVTAKTFSSAQKKRSAVVARNVRVGDYITVYDRRNGKLGLVEEYSGDEDREHLLDRLYKFACRLREAFGAEFDELFPRPTGRVTAAKQAEAAGQQTFDF